MPIALLLAIKGRSGPAITAVKAPFAFERGEPS